MITQKYWIDNSNKAERVYVRGWYLFGIIPIYTTRIPYSMSHDAIRVIFR